MSWDGDDSDFLDGFVWGLVWSPIGFGAFCVLVAACALYLWVF